MINLDGVSNVVIGQKSCSSIAINGSTIWRKNTEVWTLFDNGYVDGIEWEGNQKVPSGYTAGSVVLQTYIPDGYMMAYLSDNNSSLVFYAVLSTVDHIAIPQNATNLNIELRRGPGSYESDFRVSILPDAAAHCIDTSQGGAMASGTIYDTAWSTRTYPLAADLKGTNSYKLYLLLRDTRVNRREMHIRKVWFT